MKKRVFAFILALQMLTGFSCAAFAIDEMAVNGEDVVAETDDETREGGEVAEEARQETAESEVTDDVEEVATEEITEDGNMPEETVPEMSATDAESADAETAVVETTEPGAESSVVETPDEVVNGETDITETPEKADDAVSTENEAATELTENSAVPAKLTSSKLTVYIDVPCPTGEIIPSKLLINVFSYEDLWLSNNSLNIDKPGQYILEIPVPEFESGTKFKVYMSDGAEYITYGTTRCEQHQYFVLETPEVPDINGQMYISDVAGITVYPMHTEMWSYKAEQFINSKGIKSTTPYMIWVSKANYTVSVFVTNNGKWECIKHFGCSIGAPNSPTVVGQFKYIQYQKAWDYGTYYVGPVMRFYRGYAIHSTLIKKDGTDYDGRIGKMISHGCVRVRPENMNWLISAIPMDTTIYVTNE